MRSAFSEHFLCDIAKCSKCQLFVVIGMKKIVQHNVIVVGNVVRITFEGFAGKWGYRMLGGHTQGCERTTTTDTTTDSSLQ